MLHKNVKLERNGGHTVKMLKLCCLFAIIFKNISGNCCEGQFAFAQGLTEQLAS